MVVASVILGPAVGAATVSLTAVGVASLIPVAMTSFGTVIAGVGTIHAPVAAGGVAAVLQSIAATLMTPFSLVGGAAVGLLGALFSMMFSN